MHGKSTAIGNWYGTFVRLVRTGSGLSVDVLTKSYCKRSHCYTVFYIPRAIQYVVSHRIIERVYYTYSNVGSSTQILCTFIHLTVRPPTQDFGVPQKRRRYIVFFLLLLSIHLCQTKQLWDLTDPRCSTSKSILLARKRETVFCVFEGESINLLQVWI